MAGASAMIKAAEADLGTGEPNHIQKWYNKEVSNLGSSNWAWCDAAVSYWAAKSGNFKAVCPKGGRAYTVYHATDFKNLGQWHSGTKANVDKAKPGDIVFFDWGQTDNIGAIDHVGVVVKALGGGRVETIEGNTSNKCLRKTRSYTDIAGYGRPKYSNASGDSVPSAPYTNVKYNGKDWYIPRETLRKGDTGTQVKRLQNALNAVGLTPKLALDGDFGTQTENRVDTLKGRAKLTKDGVFGEAAQAYLIKTLQDMEKARTAPKPAPKPPVTEPKPTPPTPVPVDVRADVAALAAKVAELAALVKSIETKVGK